MLDRIDSEGRLYVLRHECTNGRGNEAYYDCLSFDATERKARKVAEWLPYPMPTAEPGTLAHWQQYTAVMLAAEEYCRKNGARCPVELSPQLVGLEGKRVEVVTTYGETRRFRVGKSTGWMPCHLEIARANCHSGPAAEHKYKSVRVIR